MTRPVRTLGGAAALALLLAGAAAAELSLESAVGRPIRQLVLENRSLVPTPEVRHLLSLRVGEPYDPSAVQRGLRLLAQKPEIRDASVRGEEKDGGLVLRVDISAEPLVRSIALEGEGPLKEKELRGRLRSRVDQPAYPEVLEADARTLEELYGEEGYPAARVEPRVEAVTGGLWVRATFRVMPGEPAKVVRVDLPEAVEAERSRLLLLVGLGEGSVASRRVLREGVKKAVEVFRGEGFPETRAPKARFEAAPGGVALVLPLVLGDPVDLQFDGIDEWSARPLREVAATRFGEEMNQDWAAQVADLMVDALRAEGYLNALIAAQVRDMGGRRRVTFAVQRGARVRVDRVVFRGQASVSSRTLRSYMSVVEGGIFRTPPFTREALDRDLKALRDYYVSQGYLDAAVALDALEVAESGEATVRIAVDEGPRYRIGRVVFEVEGGLTPARAAEVAGLAADQPADPRALEDGRVRLLAELGRGGYIGASAEYEGVRREDTATLDVTYRVRGGDPVRFGRVVVSGNARTQTPVILRELTFEEGAPWSEQEVLLSRQKLFRLGYFQRVRIEPVDESAEGPVRDVRVAVEEQDAGSLTFGGGYGTEEGLKGFAEVAHANLFGSGRELKLRGDFEGRDWSSALSFREPWLLGYKTDLDLSLFRQYQTRDSYNLDVTAFKASLDRRLTGKLRGTVVYTLSWNDLSDVTSEANVDDIDQYLLSSVGPVVAWDSRDDPFNPTSGFQHQFQAEWALKSLGSEVQFSRYVGSVGGYVSWKKVTLAALARAGIAADLLSEQKLPINKRFFLGGRTSVRGFDRDAIGPKGSDGAPSGGDTMLNFRAELRFPLWKSLGGDVFWDAGNVWDRTADDSPDYLSLRQGAGGGLRYLTPVGPIAFDLGWKLDREEGEAGSAWNVTIGNVF